jgi:hypothetical protein
MFSVFLLLSRLLNPEGEGSMFSFNSKDEGTMVFQNLETTHPTTASHLRRLKSSTSMVIEGLCMCLKVFWTTREVKHDLGSKLVILVLKRYVRTNHETSVCI